MSALLDLFDERRRHAAAHAAAYPTPDGFDLADFTIGPRPLAFGAGRGVAERPARPSSSSSAGGGAGGPLAGPPVVVAGGGGAPPGFTAAQVADAGAAASFGALSFAAPALEQSQAQLPASLGAAIDAAPADPSPAPVPGFVVPPPPVLSPTPTTSATTEQLGGLGVPQAIQVAGTYLGGPSPSPSPAPLDAGAVAQQQIPLAGQAIPV